MKITNAWIDDPTTRGEVEPPILCVEVTEHPDVTIQPEPFAGGWTVGKFGPFVKYEGPDEVDAGDFNVRFRTRFPVVVDILLFIGPEDQTGKPGFSLPLTRARQLVRKYDADWRLLISDRAAEAGSLLWRPVQSNLTCRFWLPQDVICGRKPAKHIRLNEVDIPMCEAHIKEHNALQAKKRAAKTS